MKNKTTIKIEATPIWKIPTGHKSHKSGAGVHADKRTKRERTRGAKLQKILQEHS
jgi:hypothetical protein